MREPLVEIGNPWNSPANALAAPIPTISWLASTSSPRRAAKLVEVAIVSASDTSVIPIAAASSAPTSLRSTEGICGRGKPCGSEPTVVTPWDVRSNTDTARVERTTVISTAGIREVKRGRTSIRASDARPTINVSRLRWSSPFTKALTSSTNPSASVEKPNSFGSWPTTIVTPRPIM